MLQSSRSKKNLLRRQKLEDGVRRLSRLLEAECASHHAQEVKLPEAQVDTALSDLMASSNPIAPTITHPYTEFSKGVTMGYENCDGDIWAVLDFEPSNREDTSPISLPTRAPKLGVHPVFSGGKRSRWMTLEVDVEKLIIEDDKGLKISLMSEFYFSEPHQSLHTNIVKVALRGDKKSGDFEDVDLGFFPVTTVPTEHTISNKHEKLNSTWVDNTSSLRIIFWLPVYGSYKFNLYGMSVGFE